MSSLPAPAPQTGSVIGDVKQTGPTGWNSIENAPVKTTISCMRCSYRSLTFSAVYLSSDGNLSSTRL